MKCGLVGDVPPTAHWFPWSIGYSGANEAFVAV
jgi:hypothetical protein